MGVVGRFQFFFDSHSPQRHRGRREVENGKPEDGSLLAPEGRNVYRGRQVLISVLRRSTMW